LIEGVHAAAGGTGSSSHSSNSNLKQNGNHNNNHQTNHSKESSPESAVPELSVRINTSSHTSATHTFSTSHPDNTETTVKPSIYNWDFIAVKALQFWLFLLCYQVARLVFSPIIWKLHFYGALLTLLIFIIFCPVFVVFVSDVCIVYVTAMMLPPYLTERKAEHILFILAEHQRSREITEHFVGRQSAQLAGDVNVVGGRATYVRQSRRKTIQY
jgi:hypothetical protein